MASDVFLCHCPADKAIADKMCDFLEGKDISCWITPSDFLSSKESSDSILREIIGCRILVLIFSKSANNSESIQNEVKCAVNAQKTLIFFRIDETLPAGELEFYARGRCCVNGHIPPMDYSFEELSRLLKPWKPKHITNPEFTASYSGTIPEISPICPRSEVHGLPVSPQSVGPLRVSFNFNRVVVTGHTSSFEYMVENTGNTTLERIQIVVESRGIELPIDVTLPKLACGHSQRQVFEIKAVRSGHFVLQVTVKWREGAEQLVFVGSQSLRINAVPSKPKSTRLKNRSANSDDPETHGGWETGHGELVASETFHTLKEVLKLELPEDFKPVDLFLDYEVGAQAQEEASSRSPLRIPDAFLNQIQAGTILKLEPVETSETIFSSEVRLIARPNFGLGRSREEADFLVRFWPRNAIHDSKTMRISKKHCVLTTKESNLCICNSAVASHAIFDGQDVTAPEGVTLDGRGILNLSGIYFLDVTHFPSNYSQGPIISNLIAGKEPITIKAPEVSGSVRFIPMTPHVFPQNSTWLLTDATFGSNRANAIVLGLAGLSAIQGRFHFYRNAFWIENLVDNGAIQVDGNGVEPGFIVPLVAGQIVKLGEKCFRVTVTT